MANENPTVSSTPAVQTSDPSVSVPPAPIAANLTAEQLAQLSSAVIPNTTVVHPLSPEEQVARANKLAEEALANINRTRTEAAQRKLAAEQLQQDNNATKYKLLGDFEKQILQFNEFYTKAKQEENRALREADEAEVNAKLQQEKAQHALDLKAFFEARQLTAQAGNKAAQDRAEADAALQEYNAKLQKAEYDAEVAHNAAKRADELAARLGGSIPLFVKPGPETPLDGQRVEEIRQQNLEAARQASHTADIAADVESRGEPAVRVDAVQVEADGAQIPLVTPAGEAPDVTDGQ
jgi:hypothetical protein